MIYRKDRIWKDRICTRLQNVDTELLKCLD